MLRKFVCLILFLGLLQADFIKENGVLYLDKSKSVELGEIYFATPVSKNDENIVIKGFVSADAKESVYAKDGVILEFATLNEEGVKNLKVLSEKTDEYGSKWLNIELIAYVDSAILKTSIDDDMKELDILYSQRCSACHALHEVKHFDANVWPALLDAMSERAGLSPNEKAKILKYLQYTTLKTNH